MPRLWPELKASVENLQSPQTRDDLYAILKTLDTRERSWYTCKRMPGILSFLFPINYVRNTEGYPRIEPRGEGTSKMGLLRLEKSFRKAVLGDLDHKLRTFGYGIYEVDLESCHTQILCDLKLGAIELERLMVQGGSIWKTMIQALPEDLQKDFSFDFLKKCAKRLCYKALQGGRIDTVEKIRKTLAPEEGQVGKSLEFVSEAFSRNALLMEFELLNRQIMRKYNQRRQLRVYSPIDPEPFTLVPDRSTLSKKNWYTENPCRVASQIVTGIEIFQIVNMMNQMKELQLPWIPFSMHHDGCALLVELSTFEESKERLIQTLKARLEPSGMQIKGLEFSQYKMPITKIGTVKEETKSEGRLNIL